MVQIHLLVATQVRLQPAVHWWGLCGWDRGRSGDRGSSWVPFNSALVNRAWSAYWSHKAANVNTDIFNLFLLCHISGKWPVVFVEALESRRRRITRHHGGVPSTACSVAQRCELHYQLKRGVSAAGGGLGRWLATCYEQRAPQGTLCCRLFLSFLLLSSLRPSSEVAPAELKRLALLSLCRALIGIVS